jgi:circadian clock protein KaiC
MALSNSKSTPRNDQDRCSTGVPGLDEILHGGLPAHRLYLIQGDPGVGKTTLALQFLLEGERRGEKGLYVTLSETKEEMEIAAKSHGWDISGLQLFELSAMEEKLKGEAEHTFFHPSEVELNLTTKTLQEVVEQANPVRVVFDSLSEMRLLAETSLRYRRQMLQFKQFFAGRKATVLMLDDMSAGARDQDIESIAHGVITLHRHSPEYGVARRLLNITKIRGSKFSEGNHDLVLRTGGMEVFPRLIAAEHHSEFTPEPFSCGVKEIDALLGGGLDRGTSNMIMGPPGSGKSNLALKYVATAARQGEKSLVFIFDETVSTLLNRAAQLGMDLRPHVDSGLVEIRQVDPAEIAPGDLVHQIQHAVTDQGVRMVVVDSINGYLNAMPGERYLNLQLHELLSFLNQQGIITIMVLTQQGLVGPMHANVDLTYLADTVVLLRYYEDHGSVKQAISVVKKRSGTHERTIRPISTSKEGFHVGPPLSHMQGVLSGVPVIQVFNGNNKSPDGGTM